jgi:DNA-binding PadR family transcriptional regulator
MKERVSPLGHALLGLLNQRPGSGYALRRMFAGTPIGTFSDSPGAIYPALRRLERQGLVRGRVAQSAGLRRKQLFQLTPRGKAALREWLEQPLTREDVVAGLKDVMLRFAFTDEVIGPAASVRLLRNLARELQDYVPTLHAYLREHRAEMSLSGRLALESGVRSYEELCRWAGDAVRAYGSPKKGKERRVSA